MFRDYLNDCSIYQLVKLLRKSCFPMRLGTTTTVHCWFFVSRSKHREQRPSNHHLTVWFLFALRQINLRCLRHIKSNNSGLSGSNLLVLELAKCRVGASSRRAPSSQPVRPLSKFCEISSFRSVLVSSRRQQVHLFNRLVGFSYCCNQSVVNVLMRY